MSTRSLKIMNMIREKQETEESLQTLNEITLKNAEKDLYLDNIHDIQSNNSQNNQPPDTPLDIKRGYSNTQNVISLQNAERAVLIDIDYNRAIINKSPETVLDLQTNTVAASCLTTIKEMNKLSSEPRQQLVSLNTVKARNHSNVVEYGYETDEDFSADSDDDYKFQPPPLNDSSDITDLSDYEIEPREKKITRKRKSNPTFFQK